MAILNQRLLHIESQGMNLEKLVPENDLETLLERAQAGAVPMDKFLPELMSSELFIVSVNDVPPGAQGLHPLLFDRDGVPMAAVFTGLSRVSRFQSEVKSVVRKKGVDLLKVIPQGYGVVINPGFDTGLELLPEGVVNILSKYA